MISHSSCRLSLPFFILPSTWQILSSGWSSLFTHSTAFSSHFIYCILQLQNLSDSFLWFLVVRIWRSHFYDFSVKLLILFTYYSPDLFELSCSSLSFLKNNYFEFFIRQITDLHSFRVCYCKIIVFFVDVMFPWFLMFLKVLCCCLHIWKSSYFFWSLTTNFGRKIPYINLVRDSKVLLDHLLRYAHSKLLVSSLGGILKV